MNKPDTICTGPTPPVLAEPAGAGNVSSGKSPSRKPRMVGLDVMRFIAVMMVLYAHAEMFPPTRKFFMGGFGIIYDALYQMRLGAWVAIDLFFVLSGFLISGLLFEELKKTGDVSVGRFLIRRGFKIYPVFWLMILATVIGRLWLGQGVPLRTLFTELCFVQNYVIGPPPTYYATFWGITWSLGVEEHFYFLMAGLVLLLKRRNGSGWGAKIHGLPKLFFGVAIGCVLARLVTCLVLPFDIQHRDWFLKATHVRMDALFFGVVLSYYWHYRWDESFKAKLMDKNWLFAIAGVALLLPAVYQEDEWFRIFGFVFTYVGSGYLLISLLSLDRSPSNWCIRAMAWLGRHSYSVYLWHIMAGSWLLSYITFKSHHMTGWTTNLFIYFVMCWTVGVFFSVLVEIPMLKVRDRFFPWVGGRSGKAAKAEG